MEISGSAFNAGLSTIQSGQRRVDQAAAEIAGNNVQRADGGNPQTPPASAPVSENERAEQADLATSLVALQAGQNEVEAGAKVVKTADEVLGTLIDTRA